MATGKKTGGRKAGTPNKASAELKAQLEAMGYGHPVVNMAALAMRVDPAYPKSCKRPDLGLAAQLHSQIARYIEPQRKALEVSRQDGKGDFTLAELLATMRSVSREDEE